MQRVIGIGIDGTTVSITMGKTVVPCLKGGYADSLDPQFLSYMGSQEQDEQTDGVYKTEDAAFTMSSVVFRTVFMPAVAANGAGNTRFPVVALRSHPELGDDSDLLVDCRLKNLAAAIENSSKAEETEIKLSVRQIKWTDARITINRIAGVTQGTASI